MGRIPSKNLTQEQSTGKGGVRVWPIQSCSPMDMGGPCTKAGKGEI